MSWVIGLSAAALTVTFFRLVNNKWPEKYYQPGSIRGLIVSRSFLSFIAYRYVPVYLGAILAISGSRQAGGNSLYALFSFLVVYMCASPITAFVHHYRKRTLSSGLLALHVTTSVAIILVVIAAYYTHDYVSFLSPDFRGLATNIWSGLIAAAIAVLAFKAISRLTSQPDQYQLSRRELDPRLVEKMHATSFPDVVAILAIALTENAQRPSWVRALERTFVRRNGTYGLMQIKSQRPLNDEQSVELFLAGVAREHEERPFDVSDRNWPGIFFRKHNDDDDFVATCIQMYREEKGKESGPGQETPQACGP